MSNTVSVPKARPKWDYPPPNFGTGPKVVGVTQIPSTFVSVPNSPHSVVKVDSSGTDFAASRITDDPANAFVSVAADLDLNYNAATNWVLDGGTYP